MHLHLRRTGRRFGGDDLCLGFGLRLLKRQLSLFEGDNLLV
jgi:hypothetical protein